MTSLLAFILAARYWNFGNEGENGCHLKAGYEFIIVIGTLGPKLLSNIVASSQAANIESVLKHQRLFAKKSIIKFYSCRYLKFKICCFPFICSVLHVHVSLETILARYTSNISEC